jgi:hypothetical protein
MSKWDCGFNSASSSLYTLGISGFVSEVKDWCWTDCELKERLAVSDYWFLKLAELWT